MSWVSNLTCSTANWVIGYIFDNRCGDPCMDIEHTRHQRRPAIHPHYSVQRICKPNRLLSILGLYGLVCPRGSRYRSLRVRLLLRCPARSDIRFLIACPRWCNSKQATMLFSESVIAMPVHLLPGSMELRVVGCLGIIGFTL